MKITRIKKRKKHARAILNPLLPMYANAFLNHLSATDGERRGRQFCFYIYTKMDVLGLFLASGCFQMNGFHYIALLVCMQ
jgi:hypothetical protein